MTAHLIHDTRGPRRPLHGGVVRPPGIRGRAFREFQGPNFRGGFTIIELIVTISILVIMLLLINRLFRDTSDAVALGAATSDVIANGRAVADVMARDFRNMVGPCPGGGFLIIVNRTINTRVPVAGGGETTRQVRDDQIVFFRPRLNADPLCPSASTGYAGSSYAGYLKVFYGHGQRVSYVAGSTNLDSAASGSLGDQSVGRNLNAGGIDWTLCRQALFLSDPNSVSGGIFCNGLPYNNQSVSGYASSYSVYQGVTDVCNRTLQGITGVGSTLAPAGGAASDAVYQAEALKYTYLSSRLWVNPMPQYPYDAWRIAQTHSYLSAHVSDFVVQFAADVNPKDGSIDTDGNGNIKWYEGVNDSLDGGTNLGSGSNVFRHDDYQPYSNDATLKASSSNWPYLIRIKWRMHDPKGKLGSTDINGNTASGKWFEEVFKVNRPRP